jgi:hypothetical protein
VLAGMREAAKKIALPPCCTRFTRLRFGTLLPRTRLLFTITVPPDLTSTLEERMVSAESQFGELFRMKCKFCLPLDRLVSLQCC